MVSGGGPGRARVVIRFYGGDACRHVYLAEQLADKNCLQLHPVCHESLGYQLAHPVGMLSPLQFRDLGGLFDECGRCAQWLRSTPHEVLADNEIAAVRGQLPTLRTDHTVRRRLVAALA